MRLVKKILMSAAVVSAVAAMAAVSASAAMTATYNNDGTITLSGITTQAAEKTLLVLTEDTTDISEEKAASVTDGGIIVQIDQGTHIVDDVKVTVGTLEAGKTYYVRVGGDTTFEQDDFTVPGGTTPHKVLVGDADGNGVVQAADAAEIALYTVSSPATAVIDGTDSFYAAAYCDGDDAVKASDAAEVALHSVSSPAANPLVNTLVEVGSIGATN
ncbi:MAG: hypothetical protein PUF72_04900 [Clostridiales bacterium]|nr:hypothetical protein [Clostridiales bacterium]